MPTTLDPRLNATRHFKYDVNSLCVFQDIREGAAIFWRAKRVHSDVVRVGVLRESGGEALVGAVQAAALARHAGALHLRRDTWSGQ